MSNQQPEVMAPTCSSCRHWHEQEMPQVGPVDLGKPRVGVCREQLHFVCLPNGAAMATYPAVPANFQVCSRFKSRLAGDGAALAN